MAGAGRNRGVRSRQLALWRPQPGPAGSPPDTLPPQYLSVLPGDGTVRRGGDLHVIAMAEGFEPSRMEVFAQFSTTARVAKRADGAHGRRRLQLHVLALREPMRYYVQAGRPA